MSKSGQLYLDTQDAFDCAIDDGFEDEKELALNYAKYFEEFTGYRPTDPLSDCKRIQQERDMMDRIPF